MARRADGGSGRTLPGLRAGLVSRDRYIDAAFCLTPLGGSCEICARITTLEAGTPVEVTGEQIWLALWSPVTPRAYSEFLDDERTYQLTGDRISLQAPPP